VRPKGTVVQVFLTKTHLALVMEYAEGGNMLNCVLGQPNHRLSEVKCRWVFQQLIIGLDFCHRMVRLLPIAFYVRERKPNGP
jgi:serine/threonine protein kinase